MLERFSLEEVMRLSEGAKVTITNFNDGSVHEYSFVCYAGLGSITGSTDRHHFVVRNAQGCLCLLSEIELGVSGMHAVARRADGVACA